MVFNDLPPGEAPEWAEFLRLLKKARYHCPINGLFVVLSIESLIKDSSEQITHKARRLAQQLDLIQRTLDVRFPVYLLVTKSDLLAGFREFFADVDDPLLRNQIFGWSNPDPLDAPFRPQLMEKHLASVAQRLCSRRLALLRDCSDRRLRASSAFRGTSDTLSTDALSRRPDALEALFALPESLLRLAPRLHRYLETIFTAGEWSPKPVFLRGIYFTSSMTEGKALDEAISLATGLPLDQLPEDQSWVKSRAYFLRDLFTEKVFRESGLVTRAANTVSLLRRRRWAIFGTASAALLLFLGFAGYGYGNLKQAILDEADYWRVGAAQIRDDNWSPPIVAERDDNLRLYSYRGDTRVDAAGRPTLVQYHGRLEELAEHEPAGGLIFRPISWVLPGGVSYRPVAQRILFERWVLKPLVQNVRLKLRRTGPVAADASSVARHKEALLGLLELEADAVVGDFVLGTNAPGRYLRTFLSFLTEKSFKVDPDLLAVFTSTYAADATARNLGHWPPANLSGGTTLASTALGAGLTNLHTSSQQFEKGVHQDLNLLNNWVEKLQAYFDAERKWLTNSAESTAQRQLIVARLNLVSGPLAQIRLASNSLPTALTELSSAYAALETAASNASPAALLGPVKALVAQLPAAAQVKPPFSEVQELLGTLGSSAAEAVHTSYYRQRLALPALERDLLTPVSKDTAAWEARWSLYQQVWGLNTADVRLTSNDIGNAWKALGEWTNKISQLQADSLRYSGPLKELVNVACRRTASEAAQRLRGRLAEEYTRLVAQTIATWPDQLQGVASLVQRRQWFGRVQRDLETAAVLGNHTNTLRGVRQALVAAEQSALVQAQQYVKGQAAFPLVASARESMDAKAMTSAKERVDAVAVEINEPFWKTQPAIAEQREALQRDLTQFKAVLEPLVVAGGKLAEVEVTAFPYQKLSQADKEVVNIFRRARIADVRGAPSEELTRSRRPLARRPVDQPLALTLQSLGGERQEKLPDWWLLRAIASGNAEVLQEGSKWKVKIPVADPAQRLDGSVVLEVQLLSEKPFPKREEWID